MKKKSKKTATVSRKCKLPIVYLTRVGNRKLNDGDIIEICKNNANDRSLVKSKAQVKTSYGDGDGEIEEGLRSLKEVHAFRGQTLPICPRGEKIMPRHAVDLVNRIEAYVSAIRDAHKTIEDLLAEFWSAYGKDPFHIDTEQLMKDLQTAKRRASRRKKQSNETRK